jgi:ABC-type lipoprotein export system ATPase subunit
MPAADRAAPSRGSTGSAPPSGPIGEDITRFSGRQLTDYRAHEVGFVFPSYNLVPNLTAAENVMLPMEFAGRSKQERGYPHRSLAPIPVLFASVTAQHDGLQRYKVTHGGTEKKRPASARIRS